MAPRTLATFETDFPEDAEFTEEGDIRRPGGKIIAGILAEMLRRQELAVSEPRQHSYYGWEFTAASRGRSFRFLIQFPGPWLLLSQDTSPFLRKLLGSADLSHQSVLRALNKALAQDSHFRAVQWLSKNNYEKSKTRKELIERNPR